MTKGITKSVFVGRFRYKVDKKKRVAIPSAWRAAAQGEQDYFVLPDPRNCLVVLSSAGMEKILERAQAVTMGELERRESMSLLGSQTRGLRVDAQGRIMLPEEMLRLAGIDDEVELIGGFDRFEIWAPARWTEFENKAKAKLDQSFRQAAL
jgi:MraZ protein